MEQRSSIIMSNLLNLYTLHLLNNTVVVNLNSFINQTGFHRMLCYNADVQSIKGRSHIIIQETLPKDMYVDPYQVLQRSEIFITDKVDEELPSYIAKSYKVQLCSSSVDNIHHLCIPVHFRYQLPHQCKLKGQTAHINMQIPSVYLEIDDNLVEFSMKCSSAKPNSWNSLSIPEIQLSSLEIPVGCVEHFYPVLLLLIATISLSTIFLSYNILSTLDLK